MPVVKKITYEAGRPRWDRARIQALREHLGLTQQEMAAMIGTAREMVGRSLKSLESDGAIRMDHNRIIITDRKALMATAGLM